MGKNKILFWPGRGADKHVLEDLLDVFRSNNYEIKNFGVPYDSGCLDPERWEEVVDNEAVWWIGLSLGASLMYYCTAFAGNNAPERLTIINPFFSRSVLAKEQGFSLNGQWDFDPVQKQVRVRRLEAVLSIFDTRIPMYHGTVLLEKAGAVKKNLILVQSDHVISNLEAQLELAAILLEDDKHDNPAEYHYCHLYQSR